MATLGMFLWKSIVVSGLFTSWYLLALRGRRLHQYNRFFLLSALFASLTIPFLHFTLFTLPATVTDSLAPVARFVQPASSSGSAATIAQQAGETSWDWLFIGGAAVAGISAVLLLILLARIFTIRSMCRRNPVMRKEGINLILTDAPGAPFAFLNYLFWKKSMPLQDEAGKLIFRHELAHIQQGHTYDKLACQVLTCLFWFNPFYWIIQKELDMVHEFVADEYAVDNRDPEAFAIMLLQSYNNGSYLMPEHHFFASTVRRRLAMLQNVATPAYASLRRFAVLPLMAVTIMLFSFSSSDSQLITIAPAKKKIVVLLDAGRGRSNPGAQFEGLSEKDISLECAKRIGEMSAAYNVEVRLARDNNQDMLVANRLPGVAEKPADVFVSLLVGDEPGREEGKGDFDIYVSGTNEHAVESSNYSNAIFQAMVSNGVIPGIARASGHVHTKGCNCNRAPAPGSIDHNKYVRVSQAEQKNASLLANAQIPGLVMKLGNIKNREGMRQITDEQRLGVLCDAILKGIVAGAAGKERPSQNTSECRPESSNTTFWQAPETTAELTCR